MKHSGEVVKCLPSEIKEKNKLCCQYPACGQSFINEGALSTHKKFKHPFYHSKIAQRSNFVKVKSRLPISQPRLPFIMVSHHSVSAISVLSTVPYIFPVLRQIEAHTPAAKIDKRKFNKGEADRTPRSFLFKATAIDEYLERKEISPSYGQDEYAQSKGLSQGQISKWVLNREKGRAILLFCKNIVSRSAIGYFLKKGGRYSYKKESYM